MNSLMKHQTIHILDVPDTPKLVVSDDGYIRVLFEIFLSIPIKHLLSGLDEEEASSSFLSEGATLSAITGYTEWVSTTLPALSIGWDWQLKASHGRPYCERLGEPRSNVMLIDVCCRDLGVAKTTLLLEKAIDKLAWQEQVLGWVNNRYMR